MTKYRAADMLEYIKAAGYQVVRFDVSDELASQVIEQLEPDQLRGYHAWLFAHGKPPFAANSNDRRVH